MHDLLSGLFSYPFIQRALIAGTLVALCSALLGVSLVLKRYSMIGDGLSHVGFGAMAVAMALGAAPLAVALPVVILAAFFLLRLSRGSRLAGDSAIALVSSGAAGHWRGGYLPQQRQQCGCNELPLRQHPYHDRRRCKAGCPAFAGCIAAVPAAVPPHLCRHLR